MMHILSIFHLSKEIMKFVVTGTTAALVHLGSLYVLTDLLGVWYVIAVALSFLLGFVVSFTLQKFWTFGDHDTSVMHTQLMWYFMTAIGSLAANVVGVYALVEGFGLWYMLAQFIVLIVIAAVTFFIYKFLIFNR